MNELKDILDYRQLTAMYRKPGTFTSRMFTETFYDSKTPVTIFSDDVEYVVVVDTQTHGRMNLPDAAANVIQPNGLTKRNSGFFRIYDKTSFTGATLRGIRRREDETLQRKGIQEVEEQMRNFRKTHDGTKEVALRSIFLNGRIELDSNLSLLQPTINGTTGAVTSHPQAMIVWDFGIPDANRGLGDGGTLIGDWGDVTHDIARDLDKIDDYQKRRGLPIPRTIWLNADRANNLFRNQEFEKWAVRNPDAQRRVLQRDTNVIENLWGKRWVFIREYFDNEYDGVQTPLMPAGQVLMVPDGNEWFRPAVGGEIVNLNNQKVFGPAIEAVNGMSEVFGPISYARLNDDPASVDVYALDNWGYDIPDPRNVMALNAFTTNL